jgi:hypothetical protein
MGIASVWLLERALWQNIERQMGTHRQEGGDRGADLLYYMYSFEN